MLITLFFPSPAQNYYMFSLRSLFKATSKKLFHAIDPIDIDDKEKRDGSGGSEGYFLREECSGDKGQENHDTVSLSSDRSVVAR